jgi:hypothetical protein
VESELQRRREQRSEPSRAQQPPVEVRHIEAFRESVNDRLGKPVEQRKPAMRFDGEPAVRRRDETRSTHAHELCEKTLLFFARTHVFDDSVGMYDVEAAIGKRELAPVSTYERDIRVPQLNSLRSSRPTPSTGRGRDGSSSPPEARRGPRSPAQLGKRSPHVRLLLESLCAVGDPLESCQILHGNDVRVELAHLLTIRVTHLAAQPIVAEESN